MCPKPLPEKPQLYEEAAQWETRVLLKGSLGASKVKKEEGKYDLALILRIVNFKSRAVLHPKEGQSWTSVVEAVNRVLKEAGPQGDECVVLEKLLELEIPGIGVSRASALLAAWDPERFAIIDTKMFDFFRGKKDDIYGDTYGAIEAIFPEVDRGDEGLQEELKGKLKVVKEEFEKVATKEWKDTYQIIYPKYLSVLRTIRELTSLLDLRAVEWEIWHSMADKSRSDS